MRFYQEITLIKTPEISPYFIWSKLYTQLHLALVEQQNLDKMVNIGVSFPEYAYQEKEGKEFASLGTKLRIFASSEQELQKLNLNKWLDRLMDYVHIKSIRPIPSNANSYLLVKRYRVTTNLERLTRRFMRRESKRTGREISFEEAQKIQNLRFLEEKKVTLEKAKAHYTNPLVKDLPFVKIKSLSGEQEFSLLINQQPVDQQQQGSFSTYGLSSKATVPNW